MSIGRIISDGMQVEFNYQEGTWSELHIDYLSIKEIKTLAGLIYFKKPLNQLVAKIKVNELGHIEKLTYYDLYSHWAQINSYTWNKLLSLQKIIKKIYVTDNKSLGSYIFIDSWNCDILYYLKKIKTDYGVEKDVAVFFNDYSSFGEFTYHPKLLLKSNIGWDKMNPSFLVIKDGIVKRLSDFTVKELVVITELLHSLWEKTDIIPSNLGIQILTSLYLASKNIENHDNSVNPLSINKYIPVFNTKDEILRPVRENFKLFDEAYGDKLIELVDNFNKNKRKGL